jgi:hypothetical protein
MKVAARIGKRLQLLLDYLSTNQIATLEELLQVVYEEGRSQGYREGNPGHDDD